MVRFTVSSQTPRAEVVCGNRFLEELGIMGTVPVEGLRDLWLGGGQNKSLTCTGPIPVTT